MDKSAYKKAHYPQEPPEMNASRAAGSSSQIHMPPAPPSYAQATGSPAQYPPVTVLPTPNENTSNRSQTSSPGNPPNIGYTNYSGPQYGAMGGGHDEAPTHSNPQPQLVYRSQLPGLQPPVLIIQQQAVLTLGPEPAYVICPACHFQKLTRIEYEPSSRTHLMAAILCVLGLWCCVCLPYCAGSCMNANHYCGNCNKFLGTYGSAI